MLPLQEIYAPAGSMIRGELMCLQVVYRKTQSTIRYETMYKYTLFSLQTGNSDLNKTKGRCTYFGNMADFTNRMEGSTFVKLSLF